MSDTCARCGQVTHGGYHSCSTPPLRLDDANAQRKVESRPVPAPKKPTSKV